MVSADRGRGARGDRVDHPRDQHHGVAGPLVELQAAGVDPGDVQQLGDQPAQPVGVGVDRGEHQLLLLVVELVPAVQQRLHEPLDAGQRGPQLVGDGRHEVGAVPVQAGAAPTGAEHHRDPVDRAAAGGAVQAGGQQHLVAVGQQRRGLGDGRARGQTVVGTAALVPGPAVLVGQAEHLRELTALEVRGLPAEHPRRDRRDPGDPPVRPGQHDAVGEQVERVGAVATAPRLGPRPVAAGRCADA